MSEMSSLGRLFDYAKVTTVDVRENYTTQALAEAFRRTRAQTCSRSRTPASSG